MFSFFKRQQDAADRTATAAAASAPGAVKTMTTTPNASAPAPAKSAQASADSAPTSSTDALAAPALTSALGPQLETIIAVSIPMYRVKNSYVEYVVDVTGERRTWRVYRRYQQFKALDQTLRQLSSRGSPNHGDFGALPVLPRSHWMEVTNQSAELVDRRRRYLEAYLQQLLVPRNSYYTAHTALYPFLHEGEVPIDTRQRVLFPALLGLSTINPNSLGDDKAPLVKLEASEEERAQPGMAGTAHHHHHHLHQQACSHSTSSDSDDNEGDGEDSAYTLNRNLSVRASAKHAVVGRREVGEGDNDDDSAYADDVGVGEGEDGSSSPLGSPIAATQMHASRSRGRVPRLQELLEHSFIEGEESTDDEAHAPSPRQADGGVDAHTSDTDDHDEEKSGATRQQRARWDAPRGMPAREIAASASCNRLYDMLQPMHHPSRQIGGTSAPPADEDLHILFRSTTAEGDVRLPAPATTCMNCRREFTSVLFPRRCFFCKHQFCEHCLHSVQLSHTRPRGADAASSSSSSLRPHYGSDSVNSPLPRAEDGTEAPNTQSPNTHDTVRPDDSQGEVVLGCSQCAENFARRVSRYTHSRTGPAPTMGVVAQTSRQDASAADVTAATLAHMKPLANKDDSRARASSHGTDATRHSGYAAGGGDVLTERHAPETIPSVHSLTSISSVAGASGYSAAGPNTLATPALRGLLTPSANQAHAMAPLHSNGLDGATGTMGKASRSLSGPPRSHSSSSLGSTFDGGIRTTRAGGAVAAAAVDLCLDDFQLLTVLGQGTFGKVLKVLHKPSEQIYAMKVLNKAAVHKRCMTSYTIEEMRLLTEVLPPHPYTVHCHFAFQTPYYVFMVIDYLPGGEFFDYIYPNLRLTTSDVVFYSAEVVLALGHLHEHDVAHRDLKPENIVMDADGHAHLTDFGLARSNFSQTRRRSFVGSAEYVPPETIHGEVQTTAVDWWSFGVLLYELLAGVPPFHADNNSDVYKNVVEMTTLPFQPAARFSPEAISLISQLLERDVSLRLQNTAAIQAHPFYASIDWTALLARAVPAPHRPSHLFDNDTRFFKRTFTSEWATVPLPPPAARMTRRSLYSLQSCFSPFPLLHHRDSQRAATPEAVAEDQVLRKVNSEEIAPVRPAFQGDPSLMVPLETTRTNTLERLEAQLNMDRAQLCGTWEIVRIEVRALDGRVTYPWGGAVSGMLVYTPQGTFSLQVAPAQSVRRPLTAAHATRRRQVNGVGTALSDHVARQEDRAMVLEAMLNSFSACFGRFSTVLEPTTSNPPTPPPPPPTLPPSASKATDVTGAETPLSENGSSPVRRNFVIRHQLTANLVPDLSGKPMDMYYELEAHPESPRTARVAVEAQTPLMRRGDVQNLFRDGTHTPLAPDDDGGMLLRLATRAQPVPGETFSAQTILTWRRTATF